jgi:hypothetical protein
VANSLDAVIFGQFKRSKYSLKAKYLPNSERYKYSEQYYNPKGSAPTAALAHSKQSTDTQSSHTKRLEEQRRTQNLQRPEVTESSNRSTTNQTDQLTRERMEEFKQLMADWPNEHFDRELLVKQAQLDLHEHLLHLDQMQRMLVEQSQLTSSDCEDDCADPEESHVEIEKKREDEVDESIASTSRLLSRQKETMTSVQSDEPDISDDTEDDHATQSIRDELLKQLPVGFPLRKDWRDDGVIGAVLDQGACGGCWAISTVQTIESMVGKCLFQKLNSKSQTKSNRLI